MSKKKKTFSKNMIFSTVLLALFVVFFVAVMLWEYRMLRYIDHSETNPTRPSLTIPSEGAELRGETGVPTTVPPETTLPQFEARKINFLLVGRDAHGEGENGRSDSMMVCSVDTGRKTVTLISFLRDMYVSIPGYRDNRLNAAYSMGGSELLIATLEQNFDVTVDVSLEIDFEGFVGLIDKLGGVDITLTEREARHLGGGLIEGVNHLDGGQALAYSRIRYLDSDFVRTERQRNVLTALLEKYRAASFATMLDVTDAFLDESTSDHTDEELLGYALELYSALSGAELTTRRIPADGTYTYETIRGMSVIGVDFEENRELLAQLLG